MAVIDLDLGGSSTTYIDESNADDGDVVHITALGSHTLVVDDVDVVIGSIAGVTAAASPTFVAGTNGGITLDMGLLNIPALSHMTFEIEGKGDITLDGSAIDAGSLITNLLNDYTVDFTGNHVGTFTYVPPSIGLLSAINFEVNDMQAGDQFIIEGGRSWSLETVGLFGGPESAYHDGALHLTSGNALLGQLVRVQVPMTQDEANIFFANRPFYLNGGVFTFPGAVLCYADGALILTETGYRPVESLVAGDRLRCADGRVRPLVWKAATRLDARTLDLRPEMRPIRISAGALAPGCPFADLVVSPQHRIFVNGPAIAEETGGAGGLIAVKHLLDLPGIEPVEDWHLGVRYHHLLLAEHEILLANGMMSESLLLGPWSMRNLDARTRKSLEKLVPDFRRDMHGGEESRHILLKGQVARKAVKRHGARREAFFCPAAARGGAPARPALAHIP